MEIAQRRLINDITGEVRRRRWNTCSKSGKGTSMYCLKTKPFRTEGTTQRNLEKNNWKRDGKSGLNLKLLEMAHPDSSEWRELVDWPRS